LTAEISQTLQEKFSDAVTPDDDFRGETSFTVATDRLTEVAKFLAGRPDKAFDYLEDICGVDYPGREKRFEAVYHLYSIKGK